MRIKFKVNLKGKEAIRQEAQNQCRRVLMKSMFKMEELAIIRAPADRGFLRENITLFPQILANKYYLRSLAKYSEDLEYGNTPRLVKFDVLLAWAKRKKIRGNDESAAAFAAYVQKKIKKFGVNKSPFMRPALTEVENIWLPIFAKEEKAKKSH